jgi:hypothetical protein
MAAYRKSTRQEVAVKIVEKANATEQDVRRIDEEIENLYKFNHVSLHPSATGQDLLLINILHLG